MYGRGIDDVTVLLDTFFLKYVRLKFHCSWAWGGCSMVMAPTLRKTSISFSGTSSHHSWSADEKCLRHLKPRTRANSRSARNKRNWCHSQFPIPIRVPCVVSFDFSKNRSNNFKLPSRKILKSCDRSLSLLTSIVRYYSSFFVREHKSPPLVKRKERKSIISFDVSFRELRLLKKSWAIVIVFAFGWFSKFSCLVLCMIRRHQAALTTMPRLC